MGGPISQMLWLENNTTTDYNPFPVLADEQSGLYYSTLMIEGRRTGNYTCKITNETNVNIMMKSFRVKGMDDHFWQIHKLYNLYNIITELQQPLNPRAVWTDNNELFHICWMSQDSPRPTPMVYTINDTSYSNIGSIDYNSEITMYNANLTNRATAQNVFIQAASHKALPSDPLGVTVSRKFKPLNWIMITPRANNNILSYRTGS